MTRITLTVLSVGGVALAVALVIGILATLYDPVSAIEDQYKEADTGHVESGAGTSGKTADHDGEQHNGEGHSGEEPSGEEYAAGDARAVHLTGDQLAQLDVTVGKAEAGAADAIISAPATVAFDADRTARVGPRLRATLIRVVKDLGESVEQGEPVAILDSVELGQAKARYLTARARFEVARKGYERKQKLEADNISSEAEMLEARAAYVEARAERNAAREELKLCGLDEEKINDIEVGEGTPLSLYILASPIAGVLQHRDAVPGESIAAGKTPFAVVNTSQVWLFIDMFERNAPRVTPGQKVTFTARALPDSRFTGRVGWVSKALDEEARTVRVRATLDNPNGALRDGMFGTARIKTESTQRHALVPVDAVQTLNGESVVFVPGEEDGAFRVRTVRIGAESSGIAEVHDGLEPGDPVVTAGAFDLMSALTASGRSAAHSH